MSSHPSHKVLVTKNFKRTTIIRETVPWVSRQRPGSSSERTQARRTEGLQTDGPHLCHPPISAPPSHPGRGAGSGAPPLLFQTLTALTLELSTFAPETSGGWLWPPEQQLWQELAARKAALPHASSHPGPPFSGGSVPPGCREELNPGVSDSLVPWLLSLHCFLMRETSPQVGRSRDCAHAGLQVGFPSVTPLEVTFAVWR